MKDKNLIHKNGTKFLIDFMNSNKYLSFYICDKWQAYSFNSMFILDVTT